jgi:hypothetical protein
MTLKKLLARKDAPRWISGGIAAILLSIVLTIFTYPQMFAPQRSKANVYYRTPTADPVPISTYAHPTNKSFLFNFATGSWFY